MKRILSIIIALVLLVTVSGCGFKEPKHNKLNIVCTIFPQYDFVRNIAKDKAEVKMLVPLGTESHDFQFESLTVADLKMVAMADAVIYVGGESDFDWIQKLMKTIKNDKTKWLAMTDTVDALEELISESMADEHSHSHADAHEHEGEHYDGGAYDEHVWTSPKSSKKIVAAIVDLLISLDKENEDFYKANSEEYFKQLDLLDKSLTEAVSTASNKKLIFGDRFPFRYLCADYGLDFDAAFLGCSSNVDPSISQMTSLSKSAIESGVKVIFYMENSNPVYAKQIAKTVGGVALMLNSCHTFSKEQLDNKVTYISVMSDNISKISEALK